MPTAGIDFFRVDRSKSTRKILTVAGAFILVGMTLASAHLVSRLEPGTAHLVSLGGGLLTISGLILGFGAMAMLLFENAYLLIQKEGLLLHENGKETMLRWTDLDTMTLDAPSGVIVFAPARGKVVRWFAGKNAKEVLAKIEEAKRKADHGLLKNDE